MTKTAATKTAAAIAGLLYLATPAAGQSTGGSIRGIVTDASGARLPGTTITITNVDNGRQLTLITGDQGQFRAVALQPSPYRLVAEHTGFSRTQRDFILNVGTDAALEITLLVSGVQERVEVGPRGDFPGIADSRPSSIVTSDEIRSLPELGRNFLVLAQLLPGSGPLNTSVSRFATTRFGGPADQRSGVTTMVDGGDVDDAQWGTPTINLTQESVQEFRVFRHQFDAQYGNALGAVVSVATRSGSNRMQGGTFYFGRDDALNARNAFATQKPPFEEHRFGATIGGPIVRDRTHFFGTFEQDRIRTSRIIALPVSNPFAARENGVFPANANQRMSAVRLDHHLAGEHSVLVRYVHDNQKSIRNNLTPSADSSQVDTFSRAHSVLGEINSVLSSRRSNTLRMHLFSHRSGGTPHTMDGAPGVQRPSVTTGQTVGGDWQVLSRVKISLHDAFYLSRASHDLKFGGEVALGSNELDAHFFQDGFFVFRSDAPFDPNIPLTWPTSFQQQQPNVQSYPARQFAWFVQDDWRASSRLAVSLGLRYDIEPTLRINDFYQDLLAAGALTGLDRFVSGDRGTDTNNLQPRISAAYRPGENGRVIVRGGWGVYVARNRPWFQLRSKNQLGAPALLIEDPARLRRYPDIPAIVEGGAPNQLGTVIPDNFVQSYAVNTTAGVRWELRDRTWLDVDYVHSYGGAQTGFTDRNLPAAGPISATNPRPVASFAQVSVLENFTKSWYDALETRFETHLPRGGHLRGSYTLSRSYLDGVDFFNTPRGTQRTPAERGYSPSDQRHNLTVAVSQPLPWQFAVSGILKLVSGSPMAVQAGFDLDGDRSPTGDRPSGLPITVGRSQVNESLQVIDAFRAGLTQPLPAIAPGLLELDAYRALDLRLTRTIRVRSTHRLELTIEVFNLTNEVNYTPGSVVRNLNSPAFLERRNARDARQVQWGVRYVF